jgi:hypothetical protein
MSLRNHLLFLTLAATLSARVASGADLPNAGPLFDDFKLTLSQGERTEMLGPLFYDEWKEEQHTWAVPPLLSYTVDPASELKEFNLLYPVMTYDRYGGQYRWQLAQVLSFSGGPYAGDHAKSHFTLFPIYFQQRSTEEPGENYTAFFPFYGHVKHRLFRDEIFFVMFPLYGRSVKRDVVTDNYLYPIFDLRRGDGLRGWDFWPLAGHEHKDVTLRTNGWNEVQTIPAHDKVSALWPIFFNVHTSLGTTNPVWMQGALPLYSFERSPQRDSTTLIWPFFNRIDDREKKYREWDAPWPLIEFARGPGKTTTRVWPFYSRSHNETLESDFYFWPVYKFNRARLDPLDRQRTRIAFFLFDHTTEKNTETGLTARRIYLWPLFLHRRDFNGNERLQVLALLEPFVQGSHKVPRDYSHIWSLWRAEDNPKTGASSRSLLWNLYRRDSTQKVKTVSALFGLFQYQSGSEGSRLRLCYIPLTKGNNITTKSEGEFTPSQ